MQAAQMFSTNSPHLLVFGDLICVLHKLRPITDPACMFRQNASTKFNTEISVKKILAVINATYAVAKRKPEKIMLAGIRTLTSAIPVQRSSQFELERCTGIAEVRVRIPASMIFFFQAFFSQLHKLR